MTETLAKDIGVIAQHVRNLLDREHNLEVAVSDIIRYLKIPSTYQVGPDNPLASQSFVDIVRVTEVNSTEREWGGIKQRRNAGGALTDSYYDTGIIYGDMGVSNKLPSVGTLISCLFTGQDLAAPTSHDHSMIMALTDAGYRRVRGQPTAGVHGGDFTLNVQAVLQGTDPGGQISVANVIGADYSPFDMIVCEFNDNSQLWENIDVREHFGCGLTQDENYAWKVDVAALAGSGLSTELGSAGCLRLTTTTSSGLGTAGFRFELPSGRQRTGTVSPTMTAGELDDTGAVVATKTVEDYDLRFFGRAGARGRAIITDEGNQIVSIEDSAQFAVVTLSSAFNYSNNPPSASVSTVTNWWGPCDMAKQPSIATVYDAERAFVNAKTGEQLVVIYRQTTKSGGSANDYEYYAFQYEANPQLLWGWQGNSATEGATVAPTAGVYKAKQIRYKEGTVSNNAAYEAVYDAYLFFLDGGEHQVKHMDRLTGFRVGVYGAGLTPLYVVLTGGTGNDGASGTFTVVLDDYILAASESSMSEATGTVRSIGENGSLSEEGTRKIFNPFPHSLPDTVGGITAIYTCQKTWDDPDDEADDEFTIVGIDVMQLLASLPGFTGMTVLAMAEGGTRSSDIAWLGTQCDTP